MQTELTRSNELRRAMGVAKASHYGQLYDKVYPYMLHIEETVCIAEDVNAEADILVGCALHDTLEDTDLSYSDIKRNFGEEIADIVYYVTDELGRNRKERKEKTYPKYLVSWKAAAVKLCDRIANIHHSICTRNRKKLDMYLKEHELFSEIISTHLKPDVPTSFKTLWSRYKSKIEKVKKM